MPISGLVLTVSGDTASLIRVLEADPRIRCGTPVGARLPIVTETSDEVDTDRLHERLEGFPGVLLVDLTFSDFSDIESPNIIPRRRRRRSRQGGEHGPS